jgi:glycosyltransferase involved in cell wall biosynthesis
MKIACLSTSAIPSSTANSIQVMKVCQALARVNTVPASLPGGTVRLWVPGAQDVDWETLAGHYGLETPFAVEWLRSDPALRRYDFAWQAVHEIQRWKADLVYTWTLQAALLALWSGFPVIYELHDRPSGHIGPWLFRQLVKARGRKRILMITEALKQRVEEQFKLTFEPGLVQIAPNGVDLGAYAGLPEPETARSKLGLPQGFTAGYTGHFYPGRGTDLLFSLAGCLPEVQFLWIGGRPEDVNAWQMRLQEASIRNVTLTGFIENSRLPLYQAAADVLLMPYERSIAGSSGGNSADICSPMKMFDYLAAGRAILTSDLPVLHEVLNENNAMFCPPEDPDAWQSALQRLMEDEALRRNLGEQAQRDAAQYTWRARAERTLEGFGE